MFSCSIENVLYKKSIEFPYKFSNTLSPSPCISTFFINPHESDFIISYLSKPYFFRMKIPYNLIFHNPYILYNFYTKKGPLCAVLSLFPYSMILVTTPAPTVLPPSRIANRNPSSIAICVISLIVICTLSPGITISTPSGNSMTPVTSVVLK